jgi:hypothetical protein
MGDPAVFALSRYIPPLECKCTALAGLPSRGGSAACGPPDKPYSLGLTNHIQESRFLPRTIYMETLLSQR